MATYNTRISGFTNNSKTLIIFVEDASNNAYDLSGYDAFLYAQKYPIRANSTLDISINDTSIDASLGTIKFDLTENDNDIQAGDYLIEVIIDDGGANRITVLQNTYTLNQSIAP